MGTQREDAMYLNLPIGLTLKLKENSEEKYTSFIFIFLEISTPNSNFYNNELSYYEKLLLKLPKLNVKE